MKRNKRSITLTWLTCLSLVLSLCAGFILDVGAKAAPPSQSSSNRDKIGRDLRDEMGKHGGGDVVKVIVQLNDRISGPLNALLKGNGVKVKKNFVNFNTLAIELPASVVASLASFPEVEFVSVDSDVRSFGGHVSRTTGADNVRSMGPNEDVKLTGTGIAIAVLDSGIFATHDSFERMGLSRVIVSQDFTGEGRTDDPYGHGSHVAAIAAGNGRISNGKYMGIASNANLINLRVLNSQGTGNVSSVLAALDWIMTNRSIHNIRVVNMSLGMPAVNSYQNDPLCMATRRLVDAGIVVVAAAGNNGRNSLGNKVYGHIHSPGNEPSVITVGAVDSKGSDNRADDSIATYSSRGPTRSFWTDATGVKHFDNIIKPEISAPGNKIISVQSPHNLLVTQNPALDANVSSDPEREEMNLSGTSMAAPMVAGAAALLLQANPQLTPNMVKATLMYSAQQLSGFNMFEQGAGELNIDGAVRLAKLVRTDLTSLTPLGAPLLTAAPPAPQSTIASYSFPWSQGIIVGRTHARGGSLITNYQKIYAQGVLLSDGVLLIDGVLLSDTLMLSSGVLLSDSIPIGNGTTMYDGGFFISTGVLLDGVLLSDGVSLTDGVLLSDAVFLIDGVLLSDAILQAFSAENSGDPTEGMPPEPDTGVDYLGD